MCAGEKEIGKAEFRAKVRSAGVRNHGKKAELRANVRSTTSAWRERSDACAFVVQRGGIERLGQLTPLGGADGGTVQPIYTMERRRNGNQRPLAMRGISERYARHLA
jgi:hypothetical protein